MDVDDLDAFITGSYVFTKTCGAASAAGTTTKNKKCVGPASATKTGVSKRYDKKRGTGEETSKGTKIKNKAAESKHLEAHRRGTPSATAGTGPTSQLKKEQSAPAATPLPDPRLTSLVVRDLPACASEEYLRQKVFPGDSVSGAARLERAVVVQDADGFCRGSAYAYFASHKAAQDALQKYESRCGSTSCPSLLANPDGKRKGRTGDSQRQGAKGKGKASGSGESKGGGKHGPPSVLAVDPDLPHKMESRVLTHTPSASTHLSLLRQRLVVAGSTPAVSVAWNHRQPVSGAAQRIRRREFLKQKKAREAEEKAAEKAALAAKKKGGKHKLAVGKKRRRGSTLYGDTAAVVTIGGRGERARFKRCYRKLDDEAGREIKPSGPSSCFRPPVPLDRFLAVGDVVWVRREEAVRKSPEAHHLGLGTGSEDVDEKRDPVKSKNDLSRTKKKLRRALKASASRTEACPLLAGRVLRHEHSTPVRDDHDAPKSTILSEEEDESSAMPPAKTTDALRNQLEKSLGLKLQFFGGKIGEGEEDSDKMLPIMPSTSKLVARRERLHAEALQKRGLCVGRVVAADRGSNMVKILVPTETADARSTTKSHTLSLEYFSHLIVTDIDDTEQE